jgi:hypothetical protein
VQSRNVYVLPFQQPVITRVMSKAGAGQPILSTSTLVIQGSHLLSDLTTVRLGDMEVAPPTVTEKAIILPIPATLPAGVQGVQVIQQLQMGTPPQPHPGFESNVAPMVLCPFITPLTATTAQITLNISPTVRPDQAVTLLLNEATLPPPSPPAAYKFTLPPLAASAGSLAFPLTGVQGGGTTYFIRVSVDGAVSPLDVDPSSPNYGPVVTIA